MSRFDPDAYALAAWRMIEHAWRSEGSLSSLAAGFRPAGFEAAPSLTVRDSGRLEHLPPTLAARADDTIRLSLPLAILDVWIDMDDLADALIEAVSVHARG